MTRLPFEARIGPHVSAFVLVVIVAIVLSVIVHRAAPRIDASPTRIAALVAPVTVEAGHPAALYLGVSDAVPATRAAIRICSGASCPVDRFQPVSAGSIVWTWLANATLPEGAYTAELYVQVPTPYGFRTSDAMSWTMEAAP